MNAKQRWGYIAVRPTDFVTHSRRGKVIRQGLGRSFFCLPGLDRFCVLSTSCNSISFAADQISRENQGIEIAGFVVWRISRGEATYLRFDFDGERDPIEVIGQYLKDVVESAIRHRIANMTIEDVLRKRATLILELKKEMAYITEQWGLEIDTFEIKNVRILSSSVFAQLQARYRDTLRLDAESSALETDRALAERKLAQRQVLSSQEHELHRREAELKRDLDKLSHAMRREAESARLETDHALKVRAATLDYQRYEELCAERMKRASKETEAIQAEARLEQVRQQQELAATQHQSVLKGLEIANQTKTLTVTNAESPTLALIRSLPETLGKLRIDHLNIGDDTLAKLIRQMSALCSRSCAKDAQAA